MTAVSLFLASDKANEATNLTIDLTLSVGVNSSDQLFIGINQAIVVNNCSVVSCAGCSCAITAANANQGVLSAIIKVTAFPSAASASNILKSVIVMVGVKNPIAQGQVVQVSTTDSLGYTK